MIKIDPTALSPQKYCIVISRRKAAAISEKLSVLMKVFSSH